MRVSKLEDGVLDNVFVVAKGARNNSNAQVGPFGEHHEGHQGDSSDLEEVTDDDDEDGSQPKVRYWNQTNFADYPKREKIMTVPKSKRNNSQ